MVTIRKEFGKGGYVWYNEKTITMFERISVEKCIGNHL